MVRRLVTGIAIIWAGIALAQDVTLTASVDRASVRENESLTYVLRAQGQVRGQPDLSALAAEFRVLQTSRSTSIQMAGGQTMAVTEWLLQLMPTGPGRFTLPPIAFAGAMSNPVEIEVLPAVAGDAPADIFLEVEATPATVYTQAEVIFTIRLFRGVSTGRSSRSAPMVRGGEVIVERLGDDREYQVVSDGRTFMTLERRYAIFPQSAGRLTIDPVTLDAVVITSSGFRGMQVFSSEALELEVLSPVAPPSHWAGAAWLPARDLELTERWSADADTLTAGVPQTRTLILEAEGVQASQLPELAVLPVDGIRQYPDQPELASEITQSGLQARRIERYAVIAQTAGPLTLAGIELPWFDVGEGSWKAAILPPRPVEILPSPEQIVAPPPAAPSPTLEPAAQSSDELWRAVSAALLVAWLGTLGLWWQSRRSPRATREPGAAAEPRRASNRRLLRELRTACAANDANRAHALLLEWAALRLPDRSASSLGAVVDHLPPDLAAAVGDLERALYGRDPGSWDGHNLAAALADVDRVSRTPAQGEDLLLPLYR
ncbi:MAG TPA: BatD family protein [Gammaproteobacteria bacterium]|nr:BatD family protein [Gammaproteobacteria bacterium]